jgi:hypothetical protein
LESEILSPEKPADNDITVAPKPVVVSTEEVEKKTHEIISSKSTGGAPVKDIRKDKYNSNALLDPKSQADKDKYFRIYDDYVTSHSTMKQLAEKYGYGLHHTSRIIKWVTFQIGDPDPDAGLQVMIDNLKTRKQKLEALINKTGSVDDKIKIYRTLNSTDKLLSQIEGLLSSALIDMSDRRQVHVKMNDGLQRRSGAPQDDIKNRGAADDIKSGSPEEEPEAVVMNDNFDRREE